MRFVAKNIQPPIKAELFKASELIYGNRLENIYVIMKVLM